MKIFQKRETVTQNITYMALMAAINVIFVILSTLVPYLMFLLIFLLPFTSVIVTLYCKKRYFAIYFFATIGLCLIVTIWNISDTIFYVLPSLITGFLFGAMIEKQIHPIYTLSLTSLIQFGLTYLSIPLIELLINQNMIEVVLSLFSLSDFKYKLHIVNGFIFLISFGQQQLSYFILKEDLPKLGISFNEDTTNKTHIEIALLLILSIHILLTLFVNEAYLISLSLSYLFAIYILINLLFEKNIFIYVSITISFFLSIVLFAVFYQKVNDASGLALLAIFPFFVLIISFLNKTILSINNKK